MSRFKTMDDFNQYIQGKPRCNLTALILELVDTCSDFILDVLRIHRVVNPTAMIQSAIYSNCYAVVMFMLDNYTDICYRDNICQYIVRTKQIPDKYIAEYIHQRQQQIKKVYTMYFPRNVLPSRIILMLRSFEYNRQIEISECLIERPNTMRCRIELALEHIDNITENRVIKLLNDIDYVFVDGGKLKRFYHDALYKLAKKFPLTVYRHVLGMCMESSSDVNIQLLERTVSLLDTEVLSRNIPTELASVEQYYVFANANVPLQKLIYPVLNTIALKSPKYIIYKPMFYHMYSHGCSFFKHIDIDQLSTSYFILVLSLVLECQYDPDSIKFMRSYKCIKAIAGIHRRGMHEREIIDKVLEI